MVSFLFIWQLTFSAPLSIASGCIGLAAYAGYLWPNLRGVILQRNLHVAIPLLGRLEANIVITPGTWVAMGACLLAVVLLYRRISGVGLLSEMALGRRDAHGGLGDPRRRQPLSRGAGLPAFRPAHSRRLRASSQGSEPRC